MSSRSSPFKLTKAHVLTSFAPLTEVKDLALRNRFFTQTVRPNVKWTITGSAHALAGTRHTIEDHSAASFNRLGKLLIAPICFIVTRVLVDAEPEVAAPTVVETKAAAEESSAANENGWWACVELRGVATLKTGQPYENEYIWLTRWDDEGRIVEVRSYHDTLLAEEVLLEGERNETQ